MHFFYSEYKGFLGVSLFYSFFKRTFLHRASCTQNGFFLLVNGRPQGQKLTFNGIVFVYKILIVRHARDHVSVVIFVIKIL